MDSPLIDERKSSVLDAAERLLAKEGVDVTMDELAAAAGVG
ncbi:MAG: TetR family transcriptional regulator, partial [Acidimicrobiia bacterium]|nr:TetR family transcriptional regulator [Acidimicrobiia bacterium]